MYLRYLLPLLLVGPLAAQEAPSNQELARRIDALTEQLSQNELAEVGAELVALNGMGPAASKVYAVDAGLSVGGYGEMLYTQGGGENAVLDIYRVVTYLGYRFDDKWLFNSEIELEHMNEAAVEFAYLDYAFSEEIGFRFGHMLTPMGWINELHEPTTFWSANRPATEKYILPSTWHENGVGAYGTSGDFTWRAYAMSGFDAEGFNLDKDGVRGGRQKGSKAAADDLAYVARVDWNSGEGLTFGSSYYTGKSGQATDLPSDHATTIWDVHFQWDNGPLRIRGLWAKANVDGAQTYSRDNDGELVIGDDTVGSVRGSYIEAGWDLLAGEEASLTPFIRSEILTLAEEEKYDIIGLAYQPNSGTIFKADFEPEGDKFQFAVGWTF
jgi:hypothetical protein